MKRIALVVIVAMLPAWSGCWGGVRDLSAPSRYKHGLVIVLPGIEGRSQLNTNIARGLAEGGVPSAIEVHDWTTGTALLWGVNLMYKSRNQRVARELASRIIDYQSAYPDRPVHLVGHSGGGGIAVFILESLPRKHPITGAILLAPALDPKYDLTRALAQTTHGIWNFYSNADLGMLGVGTTFFGDMSRHHGPAAGSIGFKMPAKLNERSRRLYRHKLHQQRYTTKMAKSWHIGGHAGWASRPFVRQWLAPLVYGQMRSASNQAAQRRRIAARADGETVAHRTRRQAAPPPRSSVP